MGIVSRWLLLVMALISAPGWATTDPDTETVLHPVRLQLKWLHQFQFAGYYAALEQGYYREAGDARLWGARCLHLGHA